MTITLTRRLGRGIVAVACAALMAGATIDVQAGASEPSSTAQQHDTKARRFWVHDKHFYWSDWFAGRHRKMINFGCTRAPYYDPSPLCTDDRGFHHGLDIAMKCGTPLYAGLRGTVVDPNSAGALGSAYGPYAFRIRNHRVNKDFVIGHVLRVYVEPGDHVAKGELIARASDQGAPDGCHLHFEVRPQAAGYSSAVHPGRYIKLHLRR